MEKIITTFKRGGIALLLLLHANLSVNAGSCGECGLSSIGTISGSTTGCTGQAITFTFSGASCLYSGCTLQRQIKVFSGTTLIFTSTASTSLTHSFTPSSSGTYKVYGYVKASNYSPWCTTNCITFCTANPSTPTGACGSVTACVGETFTLSATPASGTTLKWYKGATLIGTGNSITYSESTAGSYTYIAYSYNTTTGCKSINGLNVSATISGGPSNLVISSATTGTLGQALSISGSATGTGLTYSWNFGSGASPATGSGVGPISVTYSTLGSKTITLTVSSSGGCVATITKTIKICGNASITCATGSCINTNIQFNAANAGANATYTWNFGSGASPTTATGIGPHTVSYTTSGTKTATLTVGNSTMAECSDVDTRTLTITDAPSATISGVTTGTINTNYTFTTPTVTGASYSWNIPSDGIIVSGAGTASIIVKWPTNGSKTFSVTVSKNGCTSTDNHCIVIESCPVAVINSVSDICKTTPQTFSTVSQGSGVSYAWNFGSGASPATASTIGPHSVNYSTTGSKTATITVSKTGCTTKSASVTFNVNATVGTVTITPPPFNIFEDTALTYTATPITGATYTWSATGGATITGTGNSVQILFPTAGSQTISVTVSKNGCSTEATLCITVKTPVCNGVKLNHTQVPLKTSMKNYTFTDVLTGNWVKLNKPSNYNDSFHTSRKFQRNKDTAISWQEACGTVGKATIKFNRSASDLKFSIRDLDKSTSGQEIITVSAYLNGSLINTSGISATFNSSNIDDFNNTGTSVSFKGLTTATNSASTNDIALQFTSKVDSVALVLSNSYSPSSGSTSSTSPDGKYKIDLIEPGTNTSTNRYTWTWKFTNINPGSTSPAISHWDIVFPACALTAGVVNDIVSVQYSYNGTSWSTLSGCYYDYDYDPSMTCDYIQSLKIDKGMSSGNVIYYRIVLDRAYDVDYSAISFYKAGTACGQMSFAGIGCTAANCMSDIGLSKISFCITEPLPVTWLSVNALKNDDGGVNVNWATATEINNDYFSVEKSSDNRNFSEIGQVKGGGNKNSISKYMFEDSNPGMGTLYYRIKQTDYDGEFAYSAVVSVTPGKLISNVTFNPNPASSNVTVTWDAGIKEQLTLQVTDLTGVVVLSESLPNDNNVHYLNIENINNGLYLINILSQNDMVYRSRIVIAR
mgnify:CR=1 FL=1